MGTYTTNYNLFMPSIGETGWGTLVNGNFTTIDATIKSLSNSIGTLDTKTDALVADIAALEGVSNGGAIKSKSITNSGTITSTGLITGNGGFKGTLTGNVNGFIRAKLTKTNPNNGAGIVIPASTHLGKGGEYSKLYPKLTGIIITNPDETHSITVNCDSSTDNSDSKFYVYAVNIITGAVRTLGTYSCSSSTMNNPAYTYTIKLCEIVYGGGYLTSITSKNPAIYLTTP